MATLIKTAWETTPSVFGVLFQGDYVFSLNMFCPDEDDELPNADDALSDYEACYDVDLDGVSKAGFTWSGLECTEEQDAIYCSSHIVRQWY